MLRSREVLSDQGSAVWLSHGELEWVLWSLRRARSKHISEHTRHQMEILIITQAGLYEKLVRSPARNACCGDLTTHEAGYGSGNAFERSAVEAQTTTTY